MWNEVNTPQEHQEAWLRKRDVTVALNNAERVRTHLIMKQAVIDCHVTRLRSKHRLTIYPSAAMEKTNKELRSIALQYQFGRTYALVKTNDDNTQTCMFTLRVTEVLHHSRSGVPIRLECERCIAYTSIERASDPVEVEPETIVTIARPNYWQGIPTCRGPRTNTGISVEEYHHQRRQLSELNSIDQTTSTEHYLKLVDGLIKSLCCTRCTLRPTSIAANCSTINGQ